MNMAIFGTVRIMAIADWAKVLPSAIFLPGSILAYECGRVFHPTYTVVEFEIENVALPDPQLDLLMESL